MVSCNKRASLYYFFHPNSQVLTAEFQLQLYTMERRIFLSVYGADMNYSRLKATILAVFVVFFGVVSKKRCPSESLDEMYSFLKFKNQNRFFFPFFSSLFTPL